MGFSILLTCTKVGNMLANLGINLHPSVKGCFQYCMKKTSSTPSLILVKRCKFAQQKKLNLVQILQHRKFTLLVQVEFIIT